MTLTITTDADQENETVHLGFVMAQILGHATHSQNLKRILAADPTVRPLFVDVPFAQAAWHRFPLVRDDVMLQMWLDSYLGLRRTGAGLDGLLFHTESTALFSSQIMRRIPSVISLDATPLQYKSLAGYHEDEPPFETLSRPGRIKVRVLQRLKLKQKLFGRAFDAARHFVTWSEWAKGSLVTDYAIPHEKITCIPPGVDTEVYRPDHAARLGDSVRLLFVGGDFRRKGGELLLRWARETSVRHPWELHVVTRDPVPATPRVTVHHGLSGNSPKLTQLYRASEIFVLPTRADCLPVAILEAMASGLAVVSADVGAVSEAVIHGETGYVTAVDDYAALRSSLDRLVSDVSVRRAMGEAAREAALERFNACTNYRRLVETVKSVAA